MQPRTSQSQWIWLGITSAVAIIIVAGMVIALRLLSSTDNETVTTEPQSQVSATPPDAAPPSIPGSEQSPEVSPCPHSISVPSHLESTLICSGMPEDALPIEDLSRMPSANIGCTVGTDGDSLACNVLEHSWPNLPDPMPERGVGACNGYGIKNGSVLVTCQSDVRGWQKELEDEGVSPGPVKIMEYGKNYRVGSIACASREVGLTCWDTHSFHGFFLSREAAESW